MAYKRNGVKSSTYDGRDYLADIDALSTTESEQSYTIPLAAPYWDQGNIPCCVAVSITNCFQALLEQREETEDLSPLFLYYFSRPTNKRQKMVEIEVRDGLKAAAKRGICLSALHNYPFTRDGAISQPQPSAIQDGETRTVRYNVVIAASDYRRIPDERSLEYWKAVLRKGQPLCVTIPITSGYVELANGSTTHGSVDGNSNSYHTVTAIGYDEGAKLFRVRDSRGSNFGDGGDWWLPYAAVENPNFIQEVWTIQSVT